MRVTLGQVGDRVVLRTRMAELLSLQRNKSLKRVDQVSAVETTTVEVLITPGCKLPRDHTGYGQRTGEPAMLFLHLGLYRDRGTQLE